MRENRPYGSEGGVAKDIPTPIRPTRRFGDGYKRMGRVVMSSATVECDCLIDLCDGKVDADLLMCAITLDRKERGRGRCAIKCAEPYTWEDVPEARRP